MGWPRTGVVGGDGVVLRISEGVFSRVVGHARLQEQLGGAQHGRCRGHHALTSEGKVVGLPLLLQVAHILVVPWGRGVEVVGQVGGEGHPSILVNKVEFVERPRAVAIG